MPQQYPSDPKGTLLVSTSVGYSIVMSSFLHKKHLAVSIRSTQVYFGERVCDYNINLTPILYCVQVTHCHWLLPKLIVLGLYTRSAGNKIRTISFVAISIL
jgi:hypothetical protein